MRWISDEEKQYCEAKVNELALQYTEQQNSIQKEKIRLKLYDLLLRYILGIGKDSTNTKISDKIGGQEDEHILIKNKVYDSLAFTRTMEYCLKKYTGESGAFMNFFSFKYKYELKTAQIDEYERRSYMGVKLSDKTRRRFVAFNRILEKFSLEDERYRGKRLQDLSKQQIHTIMVAGGMDLTKEQAYYNLALSLKSLKEYDSIEEIGSTDENDIENDRNSLEMDNSSGIMWKARDIYESIFTQITLTESKYYKCFVLTDILNSGSEKILPDIKEYWDRDFAMHLKNLNKWGNKSIGDADIARYLEVGRPAVSKKRAAFEKLKQNARQEFYGERK